MTILGEIARIVDCEHKTAPIDEKGEYFAVGTRAMRGNEINYQESRRISRETFEQWTKRMKPRPGDILFAREAPVGPVVEVPKEANIAPGQRTVLIRAESNVAQRFVAYKLKEPLIQNQIQALSAGSTVPHLNVADIRSLDLGYLPDAKQQTAIADVLGALDGKIAANRQVLDIKSKLFSALWIKVSQGAKDVASLGDLVTTQYGYTASAGEYTGQPKFLRVMDINKKKWIEWDTVPEVNIGSKDFEKYALQKGDIVVARMADPGKCAIVDENIKAVFASYLVRLKPKDRNDALYLYGFLISKLYENYAESVSTGSVQKNMNAKVITGIELPWPTKPKRLEFSAQGQVIRDSMNALVQENQVLARTRDELLPLLMNGKISVAEASEAVEAVAGKQKEGDVDV